MTSTDNELDKFNAKITWQGNDMIVSLRHCFKECLGLRLRQREVHRRITSHLRAIGTVTQFGGREGFSVLLDKASDAKVTAILNVVDVVLKVIGTRPLLPRMVEQALRITPRERLEWTKDLRLPTQGAARAPQARVIQLNTYAVEDVERLVREPGIVEAWRRADRRTVASKSIAKAPRARMDAS